MAIEMEIRVLIIDDDETVSGTLELDLNKQLKVSSLVINDFSKSLSTIEEFRPDIVILDIYQGGPEKGKKSGEFVWSNIWLHKFMPVIIFTAGDDELSPQIPVHPFVKSISKAQDSDVPITSVVVDAVQKFIPHINIIRDIQNDVDAVIQKVLKNVAPRIWAQAEESSRNEILFRSARRRIGAMMDSNTVMTDQGIFPWEQYIYPPLSDDLLLGDVLYKLDGDITDATSYRIILTPSCDLSASPPKVDQVLVACCESKDKYLRNLPSNPSKKKERLESNLNHDQIDGNGILPAYSTIIPHLCVCYRKLEQIQYNEILSNPDRAVDGKRFKRVASIDSPFRERIAWAYYQIAGRVGIPTFDNNKWINELLNNPPEESK
ncbi:MAG: hypothetical protein NTW14_02015 [bacterium]|nr:hypothetical protein [bacterium]